MFLRHTEERYKGVALRGKLVDIDDSTVRVTFRVTVLRSVLLPYPCSYNARMLGERSELLFGGESD